MASSRSLRARALMAVLLMAGFYAFALAIIAVLISLPYLEYRLVERIEYQLLLFSLVTSATIAWAVMPRIDKFEPPGPVLRPQDAPQLFAIIDEIAAATSQPKPEEVYLLGEVNAFVAQRGGLMGIGSRRVMGVGLPLLVGLTCDELRAVIAHEFGHYVSGDVSLGPWIFKTRAAIGRTVESLQERPMVQSVFAWYWRLFMRITMKVSREQEFVADATAARIAGVAQTTGALIRVEVLAPAYHVYASQELVPVLNAGFLPPVIDGFARYLSDPDVSLGFHNYAAEHAAQAESGEFDTHPPMAERVAALAALGQPAAVESLELSTTLLMDPERHMRAVLDHNNSRDVMAALEPIAWEEVGDKVWMPIAESTARQCGNAFGPMTVDQVPSNRVWFATQGALLAGSDAPPELRIGATIVVLTRIIGALLAQAGWRVEFALGKGNTWVKDGRRFSPRDSITQLAQGVLTPAAWAAQCAAVGLNHVRLAALARDTAMTVQEVA